VKIFLFLVVLYCVFLLQVALGRFAPDLIAIIIVAVAWHERRSFSLALGFFAGFLFGLLTPNLLGLDIALYAGLGYAVSSLKNYIYHYRPLILLAAVGAIVVRNLLIWGIKFPLGFLLPSMAITLVLALPCWVLLRKVFRWKTG
jgi:rod shape-determining protein MreD